MKKKASTLDSIALSELDVAKQEGKVYFGTYKSYPSCIKGFPRIIEVEQLQQVANIRHPNFPIFYGSCVTERIEGSSFLTVTELLEGCITSKLTSPTPPSLTTKMTWAKEVALGLTWLHCNKPPIFVKSLKTSNLLFDKLNRVKVNWINEVLSNSLHSPSFSEEERTVYTAPELMKEEGEEITEKADVYSFGVILLELFFNKAPSRDMCEHTSKISFVNCPQLLKDLILGCLHVNSYQRPSFPLILDRLEKIVIESQIYEEEQKLKTIFNHSPAELFWKMNFSYKTTVSWSEFSSAFYSHFQQTLPSSSDLLSVNHPSSFFSQTLPPSPQSPSSFPHLSSPSSPSLLSSSLSFSTSSLSSSPSSSFLITSFPSSPSSPSLSSSPSSSFLSSSPLLSSPLSSSPSISSPISTSSSSLSSLSSPLYSTSSPSLSSFSPSSPTSSLKFSSPITITGQSSERAERSKNRKEYRYPSSIRRYLCLKHCLVQPANQMKANNQNDVIKPVAKMPPNKEDNQIKKGEGEEGEGEGEGQLIVTAERLSKVIKYFGPFDEKFLKRIEKMFSNKWFAYDMTSAISEKTLLPYSHLPGTFLIRISQNTAGAYCISFVHRSSRIVHTLIPYSTDGRFCYGGQPFSSLSQLVHYLISKGALSRPLSISKYTWLFEEL